MRGPTQPYVHRHVSHMTTCVRLLRVGASTGKLAAVPDSLAALLEVASKKLKLATAATTIYTAVGDEFAAAPQERGASAMYL